MTSTSIELICKPGAIPWTVLTAMFRNLWRQPPVSLTVQVEDDLKSE